MATMRGPGALDQHHRSAPSHAAPGWLREIGVLALGATAYFGGRLIVEGSAEAASRNAQRLIDVEQAIGIDIETDLQTLALEHDSVRIIGNVSYVWLHWPLLVTVVWLLYRIDRRHYRILRDAMFASGAIGLALFALFPMAPPRFMPGFVGTVSDDARRHYLDYPLSWANEFAAFPSFHVGWTLIACLALAASLRQEELRLLALVPAGLVGFAVVSTGNHYVIDAVVGGVIALAFYGYFARHLEPEESPRPDATKVP